MGYHTIMERILMHICCAPDATVPVLRLRARGWEPVGFFYDPNIHPREEYELRLAQARKLAGIQQFELLEGPYEPDIWYAAAAPHKDEPEGGLRCRVCFGVVLDGAARKAAQLGIGIFTTTLLISPHKDVRVLEEVGRECGARHGVAFLPEAFRKQDGFRQSVHLSREYGLYRQNYCGCTYSRLESERWRAAHPQGSAWWRDPAPGAPSSRTG